MRSGPPGALNMPPSDQSTDQRRYASKRPIRAATPVPNVERLRNSDATGMLRHGRPAGRSSLEEGIRVQLSALSRRR